MAESGPRRGRCPGCGKNLVLSKKNVIQKHQVKGGAFCTVQGLRVPPSKVTSTPAGGSRRSGSRTRKVRVIRSTRGLWGAVRESMSGERASAENSRGFWSAGTEWHAGRKYEE
ncbi:hypothetical protein BCF74_1347 [Knoellia remsis]|uniref:Uncharacterized protein n=1 Tax=Knoellia remsis TaxID=407159 RepID=A0A2T0U302_9MICO|nr:hypothetical protein BCF74_1347 [Knoellia remsis]